MTFYHSYKEFYEGVVLDRVENRRINGVNHARVITYEVLKVIPPGHLQVLERDFTGATPDNISIKWCRIKEAPPLTPEEHLERLGGSDKQWRGESAGTLRELCDRYPEWGLKMSKGHLVLKNTTQLLD